MTDNDPLGNCIKCNPPPARVGDAEHAPKPLGYAVVFLDSLWWPGPGHMFATSHEARQAFAIGTVVAMVPVDGAE